MFLAKIKIKNFRIFSDFELTLNEGMNLIVGENNSGKTALVDAIRYALGASSGEWARVNENDFHNTETHFHIQLKFDGILPEQAAVFVEHLTHELAGENTRKSVLYVNYEANLTNQVRRGYRYIKTDVKSGKNADGPRIEKEIRDYLAITYLKPLRDAETEMAAGRGSRLSQILSVANELTQGSSSFDALITILTTANQEIIQIPGVTMSRENIKKYLKDLTFDNDQFEPVIDILDGKDPSEMSDLEKWRLFKSILEKFNLLLDGDNPLQGLGYNNVLFIATELLLLQQEKEEFSLLIVEEPESHLHPQLQMKLLKFIRDSYNKDGKPKLQIILTTHSPNLASKAPLESLILMSKDGKAFPLRKQETQLENADYEFLEKFLDVTKSNLFFAKSVLIVEGDGENILLPTIAKLLGRPLENYGVSVVNVGNTAFARYAKIFKRKDTDNDSHSNVWIPTKVACLRDLDLWPDKAECKPENEPFGFKIKKQPENGRVGNLNFWISSYTPEALQEKKERMKSITGQNVQVYLSDQWTFEYALVFNGLAGEVYEAIINDLDTLPDDRAERSLQIEQMFDELPKDREERAIMIYKVVEEDKIKTKVAYELVKILLRKYQATDKRNELKEKLPKYILDAIQYVTKPFEPPVEED